MPYDLHTPFGIIPGQVTPAEQLQSQTASRMRSQAMQDDAQSAQLHALKASMGGGGGDGGIEGDSFFSPTGPLGIAQKQTGAVDLAARNAMVMQRENADRSKDLDFQRDQPYKSGEQQGLEREGKLRDLRYNGEIGDVRSRMLREFMAGLPGAGGQPAVGGGAPSGGGFVESVTGKNNDVKGRTDIDGAGRWTQTAPGSAPVSGGPAAPGAGPNALVGGSGPMNPNLNGGMNLGAMGGGSAPAGAGAPGGGWDDRIRTLAAISALGGGPMPDFDARDLAKQKGQIELQKGQLDLQNAKRTADQAAADDIARRQGRPLVARGYQELATDPQILRKVKAISDIVSTNNGYFTEGNMNEVTRAYQDLTGMLDSMNVSPEAKTRVLQDVKDGIRRARDGAQGLWHGGGMDKLDSYVGG